MGIGLMGIGFVTTWLGGLSRNRRGVVDELWRRGRNMMQLRQRKRIAESLRNDSAGKADSEGKKSRRRRPEKKEIETVAIGANGKKEETLIVKPEEVEAEGDWVEGIREPLTEWTAKERMCYSKLCSGSPGLSELVHRFGFPNFENRDVFTSLVRAVVWQQLSSQAAKAIWPRFLDAIEYPGDRTGIRNQTLHPDMFQKIDVQQMRDAGLSFRKAEYILGIVDRFNSGELSHEELSCIGDDEVKEKLISIKGVGAWTVDMVLMFSLDRPDVLPVGDLAVRKGAMKYFKLSKMPTPEAMESLFEPFRPYRSIAAWYMWQILDPNFCLPD